MSNTTTRATAVRLVRRGVTGTIAAALAITLAACGAQGGSDDDASTTPTMSETTPEETGTEHGATTLAPEGTGDPFADARTAASHMPETATTLATGFTAALELPGDPGSDSAMLRSQLTYFLTEHVYLAGMGVATAYTAGADSPQFEAASAAIDANSVELSELVTTIVGPEQGEVFLSTWRDHVGYFVDYAVAVEAGDQAAADQAVADLMAYTETAGQFFESNTGGALAAADVTASLQEHVTSLKAAVDALAAGTPDATMLLAEAAGHMPMAAAALATGIATATDMAGDPADEASTLRADLTGLLTDHVYAASVAVFTAYTTEGGTSSEAFTQAAAAVDANSVAISEAIGTLAGEEQGAAFLTLWRDHVEYVVSYAEAVATGDEAMREQALVDLEAYRHEAGTFFEEISGGELPADAIADGLAMHVDTLLGAVDSLAVQLLQD